MTLSLDPMMGDPELVGREIRNRLSEAGIRKSRCVVCVPLKWALTMRTELPEMSEADTNSYLSVQAEREFPFAPEHLSLSVSRYRTPNGAGEATIVAVPVTRLTALQKTLKAAKLRPVSITLGITAIPPNGASPQEGEITLLAGQDSLDLAILFGGGVVALRPLEDISVDGQAADGIDGDSVAREIRITLGQLPPDLRNAIRTIRVFGPADSVEALCAELQEFREHMGISVQAGEVGSAAEILRPDVFRQLIPSAFCGAAGRLLNKASVLEFLPPRVSFLKQITGRVSSRSTFWLGATAAAVILLVVVAFFYQYWRLSRLQSEWKGIESKVNEITVIQNKIRQFRPWFDNSVLSLAIVRKITEAFPEDGVVWAKILEIKVVPDSDKITVSCSGKARSNQEWLNMRERLRKTKGIENLLFQQVRGESPLQFGLSFTWNPSGSNGS